MELLSGDGFLLGSLHQLLRALVGYPDGVANLLVRLAFLSQGQCLASALGRKLQQCDVIFEVHCRTRCSLLSTGPLSPPLGKIATPACIPFFVMAACGCGTAIPAV